LRVEPFEVMTRIVNLHTGGVAGIAGQDEDGAELWPAT